MRALGTVGAHLEKPETKKRVKARQDRRHAEDRARCVKAVHARDRLLCRCCLKVLVVPFSTDSAFQWAHVHEIVPRSRGGDETDTRNCLCLCMSCHNQIHAEDLQVIGADADRPDGITFARR